MGIYAHCGFDFRMAHKHLCSLNINTRIIQQRGIIMSEKMRSNLGVFTKRFCNEIIPFSSNKSDNSDNDSISILALFDEKIETIKAIGHDFTIYVSNYDATCEEDGIIICTYIYNCLHLYTKKSQN